MSWVEASPGPGRGREFMKIMVTDNDDNGEDEDEMSLYEFFVRYVQFQVSSHCDGDGTKSLSYHIVISVEE